RRAGVPDSPVQDGSPVLALADLEEWGVLRRPQGIALGVDQIEIMGLATDLPGEDHVDVERELVLLEGLAVEFGHAADPVAHDAGALVEGLGGGRAEPLV